MDIFNAHKFYVINECVSLRHSFSGGARGHPDRGSSFPDRRAEVSAGSTLPSPPPTSSHYIYCEVEAQLTSCMHMSRN